MPLNNVFEILTEIINNCEDYKLEIRPVAIDGSVGNILSGAEGFSFYLYLGEGGKNAQKIMKAWEDYIKEKGNRYKRIQFDQQELFSSSEQKLCLILYN